MEQFITQLKRIFPFKKDTTTGDIVLIAAQTPEETLIYAQVGDIVRDDTRKAEWWHVTLHLLLFPPQTVTWTLRIPQFTGQESFTMGGEGRFIQAIDLHSERALPDEKKKETNKVKKNGAGLRLVK